MTAIGDVPARRLALPRMPAVFVAPAALRRLEVARPDLVVLRAPRGYGKTAVAGHLVRVAAAAPDLVAVWVNLPHQGVDRTEFWERVDQGLIAAGLPAAGPDHDGALDAALRDRDQRLLLAIDDFQQAPDLSLDDELVQLVGGSERIALIVAMRGERPLEALAEQADGVTLRAADLALDPGRARRLAGSLGHDLSDEEAVGLIAEVGGWPALLRAAVHSPERDEGGELVPDGDGVRRFLRVVAVDPDVDWLAPVLLRLAVPAAATAGQARALVGLAEYDGAQEGLRDFGWGPTPEVEGALGLPRLVRAALSDVFRSLDPEGFRATNAEAARARDAGGDGPAAIRHAYAAQDPALVADLVEKYWAEIVEIGGADLAHALATVPEERVRTSARLLLARDVLPQLSGPERGVAALRAGLTDPEVYLGREVDALDLGGALSLRAAGDFDALREGGVPAESGTLAELPERLAWLAWGRLFEGDAVGAAYAFGEAVRWAAGPDAVVAGAGGLALTLALAGHARGAAAWLAHGPVPEGPLRTLVTAALARDRLAGPCPDDEALAAAAAADWAAPLALQVSAGRAVDGGDPQAALVMLESYWQRHPEIAERPYAAFGLSSGLVEAALALGEPERARAAVNRIRGNPVGQDGLEALVDFYTGDFAGVLERTEGAGARVLSAPRVGILMALARACAANRLGRGAEAVESLHVAMAAADDSGLVRPFLMVPRTDLDEAGEGVTGFAAFARRVGLHGSDDVFGEPAERAVLSERELAVLRELALGSSVLAAARRLFVSENTVKSQVRTIYRKLDVHSRGEAIAKARVFGLLEPEPEAGAL